MKPFIIVMSILAVVTATIYFGVSSFFKTYEVNYNQQLVSFNIEKSEDIRLDFPNCQLKVEGWYKDYIEVTPNEFVKSPYDLKQDKNTLTFNFDDYSKKYSKTSFIGFTIMVPRHTLVLVTTDYLRIRDCRVKSINARYVESRNTQR